jgi:septum formation protein
VEDFGIRLFSRIEGDHFAILGLPLVPLLAYLALRGVIAP